jgi:hypothetical protein
VGLFSRWGFFFRVSGLSGREWWCSLLWGECGWEYAGDITMMRRGVLLHGALRAASAWNCALFFTSVVRHSYPAVEEFPASGELSSLP